ncbi:MAG: hypothetical protein DYG89_49910 [Caldilinea sp. CFX5]|nr:hypothetical protein [Caldilinea sp. CFX5]
MMKKTKTQTAPVIEHTNVVIHFGSQREGHTFRLHPLTNLWIQEKFPDRERVASVFIGFDRRQDIGLTPPSVWLHVATLLTGLSLEELNQLGGFSVVNPVTKQEVYNSLVVHA